MNIYTQSLDNYFRSFYDFSNEEIVKDNDLKELQDYFECSEIYAHTLDRYDEEHKLIYELQNDYFFTFFRFYIPEYCQIPSIICGDVVLRGRFLSEMMKNLQEDDPLGYAELAQKEKKWHEAFRNHFIDDFEDIFNILKKSTVYNHDLNFFLSDIKDGHEPQMLNQAACKILVGILNAFNPSTLTQAETMINLYNFLEVPDDRRSIYLTATNINYLKWTSGKVGG